MCLSLLLKLFGKKKDIEVNSDVEQKNLHWGNPPEDLDNAKWEPLLVDPKGITVTWQEKYGASLQESCIGLWFSKSTQQYLLTWKDSKKVILEKANINNIVYYH